jgi:hypothetical protein
MGHGDGPRLNARGRSPAAYTGCVLLTIQLRGELATMLEATNDKARQKTGLEDQRIKLVAGAGNLLCLQMAEATVPVIRRQDSGARSPRGLTLPGITV